MNLKAGTSSCGRLEVFLSTFWDDGSIRASPIQISGLSDMGKLE